MKINKSPWIHELDHTRKPVSLTQDIDTDVAIVGAGIAGISTAFFALKYTKKKVIILDQGKLAHGATGHNAGQVIARFERPLVEIEEEFGFEKTKRALHDLNSAWGLLEEMYSDARLKILFSRVKGYRGYSDLYQVLTALRDLEIEVRAGFPQRPFLVSEDAPFLSSLSVTLSYLYTVVPHEKVLEKLETKDKEFYAVVEDRAACMNSALFCQEIVTYLFEKYPLRFELFENTHIKKLVLKEHFALLDAGKHTVHTERVILCTNGFESLEIYNEGGLAIDKKFHHDVEGKVGYMSGYLESLTKPPTALAYFPTDTDPEDDDPYFYLTRRPHELGDTTHNLICVGGPELAIRDREDYLFDYDYPEKMHADIDSFIRKEYIGDPVKKMTYEFTWHGLMGYTPSRVRIVGEEPKNRVLIYNIGCNGIGIVPSVVGARRISKLLKGETLIESIFDPRG